MIKVSSFEIVDLGIENSQYFQGFGTSFTSYEFSAYGIGNNPREALADCLETIAQDDIDTEALENEILAQNPDFNDDKLNEANSVDDDSEDCYYHIGIRWNT